jgi:NAD(P)-dependent dehydrogenase (short-subunit alcohol dehydrogenase family)
MSGATVWVAGRDVKKLQECVDGIKSTVSDPSKVHQILCDVSSLASVKRCVEEFKALNIPLHILINNAGCWLTGNPDRVLTEDGFEMHLGTNHIGHFALTNGLLPALTLAAPNARVVNVSSIAHARSAVDLNDPFYTKRPYDPFNAYGQSKTANILHAIGLHNRFHSEGITAVSLHPGVIDTELWRHGQIGVSHNKSIPQGAATQVWCAISPDVKSGYYYNDCNEAQARAWATDKASVDQFWEMSMQWTLEK